VSTRVLDDVEIETTLRRLLLETAGIPSELIQPDSAFDGDLAMDSLSFVALQVEIESEFGIDCPPDELRDITRFGDLIALVRRKQEGGA
jgi:acyl carrier protein